MDRAMSNFVILVFCALIASVAAHSTGAGTCTASLNTISSSGTGGMGTRTAAQVASQGHSIAFSGAGVSGGKFVAGKNVTITITSPNAFEGLLLYAVDGGGNRQGSFVQDANFQYMGIGAQTVVCPPQASTITHIGPTSKPSGTTVTWTAPAAGTGNVVFNGAIVENYSTWFLFDAATLGDASMTGSGTGTGTGGGSSSSGTGAASQSATVNHVAIGLAAALAIIPALRL